MKQKSKNVCRRIGMVIALILRAPFMLVGDLIRIVGVSMGLLEFEDCYWTYEWIQYFVDLWKKPNILDD